jgi:hypothetical protein
LPAGAAGASALPPPQAESVNTLDKVRQLSSCRDGVITWTPDFKVRMKSPINSESTENLLCSGRSHGFYC